MSKATRRQIYVSDLVFATSLVYEKSEKPELKTRQVLTRINARLENINSLLYKGARGDLLQKLSPKDQKSYLKKIKKMQTLLEMIWAGDRVEADFFNALLYLVEQVRDSTKKSKNKKLQHEWKMLNQSINTFYGHIVPEPEGTQDLVFPMEPRRKYHRRDETFIGYKYQDMGVVLGKKFERIFIG